jgi:hypothetical protein
MDEEIKKKNRVARVCEGNAFMFLSFTDWINWEEQDTPSSDTFIVIVFSETV